MKKEIKLDNGMLISAQTDGSSFYLHIKKLNPRYNDKTRGLEAPYNPLAEFTFSRGTFAGCCAYSTYYGFKFGGQNQDYYDYFKSSWNRFKKVVTENKLEEIITNLCVDFGNCGDFRKYMRDPSLIVLTLSEYDKSYLEANAWILNTLKALGMEFKLSGAGMSRSLQYGVSLYLWENPEKDKKYESKQKEFQAAA